MIDLRDPDYRPSLEEILDFVDNPACADFCRQLQETFQTAPQIDFSKCSMEPGWNVKFKKSSRSLCTIYPRKSFLTVMVVIGSRERDWAEAMLPQCSPEIQTIYQNTREGNGQRWLMIDIRQADAVCEDTLRLIELRTRKGK